MRSVSYRKQEGVELTVAGADRKVDLSSEEKEENV